MEQAAFNVAEWFWRKLENRGIPWLILGYLVYQAPTVVDRIAADKEENLKRLMEIQARHEAEVDRATASYQRSIEKLVEQWKEDRTMLVGVLTERRKEQAGQP